MLNEGAACKGLTGHPVFPVFADSVMVRPVPPGRCLGLADLGSPGEGEGRCSHTLPLEDFSSDVRQKSVVGFLSPALSGNSLSVTWHVLSCIAG